MTLGLRPCAKALGIAHTRLLALWKEQRVPRNVDGSFDLDAVRAAFERTKDPVQRSKMGAPPQEIVKPSPVVLLPPGELRAEPPTKAPAEQAPTDSAPGELPGFNEVRTKREMIKLKESELDLAEREKELMSVDDARKAWGGHIAAVQSRLLLLPAKLAPRVAVLADDRECHALIEREIRAALTEISEYQPHAA